jgi:hypothetical protein
VSAYSERIVGEGNYEYPQFAGKPGSSVDEVFFTHKKCSMPFRAARGGQGGFMWGDLKDLPTELSNNLK